MESKEDIIKAHPVVGWDISTVDPYRAMMIRLHYLSSLEQPMEEANVDRTLWLTTDVARQLIQVLEQGISQIENASSDAYCQH